MTTLKKMSWQTMRFLNAGPKPKDSKLNHQYIMTELRQMAGQHIKRENFAMLNAGQRDVQPLAVGTYRDITIQLDATFKRNYIDLPSFYYNLPGGMGLQQVRPQLANQSLNKPMIIANPMEIDMISGSLFSLEVMKDQWIAEPDRNKIWFSKKNNKTLLECGINKAELKIAVIDPEVIGEDDDFPLDPGSELEVITAVLQLHGYTGKEATDLINDGRNK